MYLGNLLKSEEIIRIGEQFGRIERVWPSRNKIDSGSVREWNEDIYDKTQKEKGNAQDGCQFLPKRAEGDLFLFIVFLVLFMFLFHYLSFL